MKARALPRATSSVADSADASDYLRRVFSPMHLLAAVRDYGSPPPTRSLSASRTGKSNFGNAIATVRSATTTRRSSAYPKFVVAYPGRRAIRYDPWPGKELYVKQVAPSERQNTEGLGRVTQRTCHRQ